MEDKRKDHKATWFYTLTWRFKEKEMDIEAIDSLVKEAIRTITPIQESIVEQVALERHYLKLILSSSTQLNMSKVIKQFTKKLGTILENLDEEQLVVATTWDDIKEPNIRLEKLLNSVIDAEYYDLEDGFTSSLEDLKNYLGSRKLSMIESGDQLFLIDEAALNHDINLNCFACTKLYKYGCCCGSPCNLGPRNRKVFDKHLFNIEEEVKAYDTQTYQKIMAKGGFVATDGSINACDGHCALLVEDEGVYKCIAHSYALKRDMPIYTLCPLSCLMYPLEIIELITNKQRKIILLTAAVSEDFAKRFGRWGSYNTLEVELRCINKEGHNAIFKEEDYKPVYKVNEGLLCHEFGSGFYKSLEEVLQK